VRVPCASPLLLFAGKAGREAVLRSSRTLPLHGLGAPSRTVASSGWKGILASGFGRFGLLLGTVRLVGKVNSSE
jgi:hypothetical protein